MIIIPSTMLLGLFGSWFWRRLLQTETQEDTPLCYRVSLNPDVTFSTTDVRQLHPVVCFIRDPHTQVPCNQRPCLPGDGARMGWLRTGGEGLVERQGV
ncbi:hypothetical protein DPEC_G00184670 [Dallia pectoralis]|uniref:Uncharacterized protein n=1 Tax=Dallia pectoralis TaxID=75939 RepID=A0ACC2GBL1_DALPE|nr:hypothetical protein DPEC_G00184670 [Dallia pectoralis]